MFERTAIVIAITKRSCRCTISRDKITTDTRYLASPTIYILRMNKKFICIVKLLIIKYILYSIVIHIIE